MPIYQTLCSIYSTRSRLSDQHNTNDHQLVAPKVSRHIEDSPVEARMGIDQVAAASIDR